MDNSKILIVIHPYYQRGFEGFARELHAKGCIVAFGDSEQNYGIKLKGRNLYATKLFGRAAFWMPDAHQIIEIIKKRGIEKIHFVGEPTYLANITLIRAMQKAGIKADYSCRCAQNQKFKIPFPFSYALKLSRSVGAKVFPVSNLSLEYCREEYKIKPMAVLPNGVPEQFYHGLDIELRKKAKTVLFVGSFFERKGIKDFCRLAEKIDNYDFVAVGGGVPEAELEHLRAIYQKVKFVDRVSMDDLIKYYDMAKVVVVPSIRTDGGDLPGIRRLIKVPWAEQFCRVIIEAYARGCEVVAYDSGAISSVIRSKDFLVKEHDEHALKLKVQWALSENFDIERNIEYSQGYKWSKVAEKFLEMR